MHLRNNSHYFKCSNLHSDPAVDFFTLFWSCDYLLIPNNCNSNNGDKLQCCTRNYIRNKLCDGV